MIELLKKEKCYKRYVKQGYRAIGVKGNQLSAYPASWTDEKIRNSAKDQKLYMSLDDFCI